MPVVFTYIYLVNGQVSSKEEAGRWALTAVPKRLQKITKQALMAYRFGDKNAFLERKATGDFAKFIDQRLKNLQT